MINLDRALSSKLTSWVGATAGDIQQMLEVMKYLSLLLIMLNAGMQYDASTIFR